MPSAHVAFLIYAGCQSLDLTGPYEVFAGANRWLAAQQQPPRYRLSVVSPDGAAVTSGSGLRLMPDLALPALRGPLDTLVVAGGFNAEEVARDAALLRQLRRLSRRSRRTASVCAGAFLLAAAGLLEGRRATTHWAYCARMARRYPQVRVDAEPIYVQDGPIWTSAGVSAGIDLALGLVEQDLGREAALTIARWLVLFLRRPGTQRQFSAQLSAQMAERDPLRRVQAHIAENLHQPLDVERLAERASMSPRHFSRCFSQEVGLTPARYILRLRLENARRLLEETQQPLERVAERCGFGSTETMRRQFLRELSVNPREYRRRFHAGPAGGAPDS
ncbi:MAG TPA: DJ-1/PfpI family protein [Nevskia sp.]|jgi:transcriptional regulator GlxA family with amidase domain|nr:DJ-1/PfpI family protein [Nevskia sp.]